MRTVRTVIALWAFVCAAASAAAVWDSKPFTQWSDKDVEKLLTDSPWAGRASITHNREGANLGPVPDWKLIVTVQSALPIKQALAREALGAGVTPSPELETRLAAPSPRYVLAISNIPRLYERQLVKSAQAATLRFKGREPITATDASVFLLDKEGNTIAPSAPGGRAAAGGPQIVPVAQRGGGGRGFGGGGGLGGSDGGPAEDKSGITATLVLEFPRTAAVTPEDRDVELSTVIGTYSVKKDFKLKDMVFLGSLAL